MQFELTPLSQSPVSENNHATRPQHSSGLDHFPLEIIETILGVSSLADVAAFAQTCKAYRDLVYQPVDNHLWRNLFLNQPEYDDPRLVLGSDAQIPWNTLLQRWTAVGKVLRSHAPEYTPDVLEILFEMIEYARPASCPMVLDSCNLHHIQALLRGSGFFNSDVYASWDEDSEQTHMHSRLRVYAGLGAVIPTARRRLRARSFVYDLRNYHDKNDHGPFMPDGSGRVHWKHIHVIQEVIAMNIMDFVDNSHSGLPMSMKHIQARSIPRGIADDRDWAGLGGRWQVAFCFCDHRDLLAFNRLDAFQDDPDPAIFEDENFEEALRFLEFELRLVSVEDEELISASVSAPSSCRGRPTLHFVGSVSGNARVNGRVYMTPDEQVRWSFVSGEPGQTIWSTEAIQIGGIASAFGAIGSWTTVFHDLNDPVGPMWLWKLLD